MWRRVARLRLEDSGKREDPTPFGAHRQELMRLGGTRPFDLPVGRCGELEGFTK